MKPWTHQHKSEDRTLQFSTHQLTKFPSVLTSHSISYSIFSSRRNWEKSIQAWRERVRKWGNLCFVFRANRLKRARQKSAHAFVSGNVRLNVIKCGWWGWIYHIVGSTCISTHEKYKQIQKQHRLLMHFVICSVLSSQGHPIIFI